jgi:hypothetical protein
VVTRPWVRLPSAWIDKRELVQLSWKHGGAGADNIAALMILTAIAHAADQESGAARRTYDDLCDATGLSRAKVANGLEILRRISVVEPGPNAARSVYRLANFAPDRHWAMLPAKSMYSAAGRIAPYAEFQLRRQVELDALKLFLLFVARRARDSNLAMIGYDKIEQYTAVQRIRIKPAISFLASLSLIYIEHVPSTEDTNRVANAYRIVGLDSYNHLGTRGRATNNLANSLTDTATTLNQPRGTPPDYTPFLK